MGRKVSAVAEPNVVFASRNRIRVVEKNGTEHVWKTTKGWLRIKADEINRDVRELLYAQGGTPEIDQPWYLRRDAGVVNISWRIETATGYQTGGQPEYEIHEHHHKPMRRTGMLALECDGTQCDDEHCEHVISCSNPPCQAFFWDEWRRAYPPVRPTDIGSAASRVAHKQPVVLPIAAPNKAQRPMNTDAFEEAVNRSAEEAAGLQSAAAVGRAIADALQPHLYQERR
jgi:hypothetical protein